MNEKHVDDNGVFYLVGGGIASLAAAAFLIRDGGVRGESIMILEESGKIGGSLDGAGTPQDGYVIRGGRMLESKYLCTFGLFSSIPTLGGSQTVTQEILEFHEILKTSSRSRLFRAGHRVDAPKYGLSEKHILTLERLGLEPEAELGRSSIADQFDPSFFETDFWFMWCTTFAFQPWHSAVEFKRYLVRFIHMVAGFNTLTGIMRTVYNQYDSMVRPLLKWLEERGVRFALNTHVSDLAFSLEGEDYTVERIICDRSGRRDEIKVRPKDFVFVTLGSMVEASSLGSMDSAPVLKGKCDGGAWTLWKKIAAHQSQFGCPANFTDHIGESKWVSFTTTFRDPTFFRLVRDLTGNVPGEGGLITFPESGWLASIVLPHQPHFIGQPADVQVLWGYGLFVDKPGNIRDETDVGMHRSGDHEGDYRPPRHWGAYGRDTRNLHLHSVHDALHHQSVSASGQGRPPPGRAGALEESRLHRTILRAPGRRGFYSGIFGPLRANGGLLVAWDEPDTTACVQRAYDPRVILKAFPDVARRALSRLGKVFVGEGRRGTIAGQFGVEGGELY